MIRLAYVIIAIISVPPCLWLQETLTTSSEALLPALLPMRLPSIFSQYASLVVA